MTTPCVRNCRLRLEQLEDRTLPSSTVNSLQNFDQAIPPNLPVGWTQWSSSQGNTFVTASAISFSGDNSLLSSALSNVTGRAWETTALGAGFGVEANVLVNSLIPIEIFTNGQNLASTTPTFYAVEISRGLEVELVRVVNGVSTTLGLLRSTAYLTNQWIQVGLTFDGNETAVQVKREDTGLYLNSNGNWVTGTVAAIQAQDSAITAGGYVGVSRAAQYGGSVAIDDFTVLNPSTTITTQGNGSATGWSTWSSNGLPGFQSSTTAGVSGPVLTSSGTSSQSSRTWENASQPANVQVSASIDVNSLIPGQIIARGANLNTSSPSYYAVSLSRGLSVTLDRINNGVTTVLQSLSTSVYTADITVNVSLTVSGNQLEVRVQRADKGQWLNDLGDWQTAPIATIETTDATISAPGLVGLARPASYAGSTVFTNFSVQAAGNIAPPSVQVNPPSGAWSGTITVPISISDSQGIAQAQYYVDSELVSVQTSAPWSWVLDTSLFTNASHTLTIRVVDSAGNVTIIEQTAAFNNPTLPLPSIPQHLPSIRIAELAYTGTPIDAVAQNLLKTSVDLVISSTQLVSEINQIAPTTPQLIYANVSNMYGDMIASWDAYAAAHGISEEAAFYHVTTPTAFSGASASSQPVDWFWNVALTPTSSTLGYTNDTSASHTGPSTGVAFGAAGQSLDVGYTDPFAQINFSLSRAKQSGWTYVIEYPTAVAANGTPTAWGALTLNSDSTSGLAKSGQMTFNPPTNWVAATAPGSADLLYYVRIRTLAGTAAQAPIASTILGDDYVNANGGSTGTIPVFDYAADTNGDGYLDPAEYANRTPGDNAQFAYQSRLFYPSYGQDRYIVDPSNPAVQAWAASYVQQLLASNPLAAGVFLDNSDGADPTDGASLVESTATYTADYSGLLTAVQQAIAPKWVVSNTWNSTGASTDQVIQQVQGTLKESTIRAMASNWQQFTDMATAIIQEENAADSPRYLILDSLSTGGSETDPRTQMATLSYYYLVANPTTTFFMPFGGQSPSSDWSNHWFNALSFNIGQPVGSYSLFATGKDPSNTSLTYNIYERQYTNALVLYKPLSYGSGSGTGTTANNTATTSQLNGTYRLLNADGTLGPPITQITLRNGEGAVLIKS